MPRRRNPIGQALGQGLATLGGAYGNRLAQNYEQENQLNLLRNILSEPRRLSVDSAGAGSIDEFGNMQGVQRNVAPIFGPDNALLLAQMNPQFLNILSMVAQEEAKRVPKYDIRGTSPESGFGIFQEEYGQPPKPIDYIPPGRARTDSTEPTQLAKLQNELAAIEKANPNDPRVPQYKQRIQRELEGVQSFVQVPTEKGFMVFNRKTGQWEMSPNAPGLVPTAEMRNRDFALERIGPVLSGISELSEKINTGKGVIAKISGGIERAKAEANLNDDVAEYEALISGFTPMVARAVGHTGVLTEQDVQSVRKLFPSPGDSKSLRDRKIARLKTILGITENPSEGSQAADDDPLGILGK